MSTARRINVILPESTIKRLDKVAKPGERSQFIDKAVRHYITTQSKEALRALLEYTTVRDIDLNQKIMEDWADVDRESWQNFIESHPEPDLYPLVAVKSTSRSSIRRSVTKSRKRAQR
jgi:metal-responsive CopG/Arc/MetJ family transcriptional regulator